MPRLGRSTGGTSDEDRAEAVRLLKIIDESGGARETKDVKFVEDLTDRLDNDPLSYVSGGRVFWLRDIRDRVL